MSILTDGAGATWGIAALATAGVIIRPWRMPEAVWAVLGAAALVGLGLLPWADALLGVRKGLDVYLFLTGMMLLAELARHEGLFDWLAALAVEHARGSPQRLFTLVYVVGTLVTVLLSNDATAVVLTPAVYCRGPRGRRHAAALSLRVRLHRQCCELRAADLEPGQPRDLRRPHAAAAVLARAVRAALGGGDRRHLSGASLDPAGPARAREDRTRHRHVPQLSATGRMTACGIGATAVALLLCSAFDLQLGLPTFVCGVRDCCDRSRISNGSRRGRCCVTSPGACCRWSPGCSFWSKASTERAWLQLSPRYAEPGRRHLPRAARHSAPAS